MQTQIYTAWIACTRVSIAENTDEYNSFEILARIILESHPCSKDDIRNATWYALKNCSVNTFTICRQCLLAFIVCLGFGMEFKEVNF